MASTADSPAAAISQAWRHSHEEDSADEMVFRPATFAFPRSRGRAGYDFRADGSVTVSGPSPEDKQSTTEGHWELPASDTLILTLPNEIRKLQIVSATPDKLVLRRNWNG
ncbi:MAG: hypothetical protein ABSH50_19885 [Bryobacteraceae bacterium]|jgi:hypothetical protein